jgi:hypothetical protein
VLCYNNRLSSINGTRLDVRRLQTDLITTYKIINNFISLDIDEFFNTAPSSITRGHAFKLFVDHCRINIRQNFFANCVINCWNSLPADLVMHLKQACTNWIYLAFLLINYTKNLTVLMTK